MSIISEIEKLLTASLSKAFPQIKVSDFKIETSKRSELGDYATNLPWLLRQEILKKKKTEKSPDELMREIVSKLSKNISKEVATLSFDGSVFLNIKLADSFLNKKLKELLLVKERFFNSKILKGKKIIVEFVSANPTGPLTLANGRGGFSGDVLSRVLTAAGGKVTKEYYINDVGRQVEILAESVALRYLELLTKKIRFPEYAYQGEYITDLAKEVLEEQGDKYKDMAVLEIASRIQRYCYEKILGSIKQSLKKMGIEFDSWFSEKSLYETGQIEDVLSELSRLGLLYETEGALWFKSTEYGDDKDRVIKKADGAYTYFASDIAYHFNKLKVRNYDLAMTLLGADHAGYVPRLKACLIPFKLDKKFVAIVFQLVRLFSGGKEIRMSKRRGTYVTMDELLDEVPVDAARYFFLTKAYDTHLDFNLDLAKEQSQKNPVFYIQYASARISSLKKEAAKAGLSIENFDLTLLDTKEEKDLIKEIVKLPDVIESIAKSYAVQALPDYTLKLARAFHIFYDKCRIVGEETKIAKARLALVEATKLALDTALKLMGISAPQKM